MWHCVGYLGLVAGFVKMRKHLARSFLFVIDGSMRIASSRLLTSVFILFLKLDSDRSLCQPA